MKHSPSVTTEDALAFVRKSGIVLEAAQGPVPTFAVFVANEPIRGSWWGLPAGRDIFRLTRAVRHAPNVLVCRLVNGKVTYIHRRLWPAIVRVAKRLDLKRLAALREVHTAKGKHRIEEIPFPDWVPQDIHRAAGALDEAEAAKQLPSWLIRQAPGYDN
jgi:hypothetical protein